MLSSHAATKTEKVLYVKEAVEVSSFCSEVTKEGIKRKRLTNEKMKGAMKAVASGEYGINRAALDCGVPRTTLKGRLSGRVEHGRKPGPAPYLNAVEETELGKSCASVGYGKTRKDVMHIAEAVATEKGVLRKDNQSRVVAPFLRKTRTIDTSTWRQYCPCEDGCYQ